MSPRPELPRRHAALLVFAASLAIQPVANAQHSPAPPVETKARFDHHRVVRAQIESQVQLEALRKISGDMWSEAGGIGPVDFRIQPESMAALEASGVKYEVIIDNVQALIDRERLSRDRNAAFFESYHPHDELDQYLLDLENIRPDIAERIVLGESLLGHTVYGIRITSGNQPKPAVLYNGCQHAREWITTMATTYFADQLVHGYGSDPEITSLVDDVEIFIVPVSNPDGYRYTWNTDRLWRKNRRNNGGGRYGVDLNRNWGYQWGGEGSSSDPESDIYRGTGPFSEPETQNLRDFLQAHPNIMGHVDVHSFSQLVLEPWGWTASLPPDYELTNRLGGEMADAMIAQHGNLFVHGPSYTTIYPAAGVAPDWTYGELGIPAFTYELRDLGEYGFILPADQIVPASEEMVAGARVLADWVRTRLLFTFPEPLPTFVDPGTPADVQVSVEAVNGATLDPESVRVYSRNDASEPFTEAPMSALGEDAFEGPIVAAACGDNIQFWFAATATDGSTEHYPDGAPDALLGTLAINSEILVDEDFESAEGWTVSSIELDDGEWERGIPAGPGDRGDPTSDYDGSGQAYLTANRPGNSDVDGGPTRLTSPPIDLQDVDAVISYARWFYNDDGDDRLTVEVSNDDGSTWALVESVGAFSGWAPADFRVSEHTEPSSTIRVRFSASDNPNDSVTEAALDAFRVTQIDCDGIGDFALVVPPLSGGAAANVTISGAAPSSRAWLAYSLTGPGSTFVPPLDVTLDLENPQQAGNAEVTDGSGDATFRLAIPPAASGRTIWFQALQSSAKSNPVEATVD